MDRRNHHEMDEWEKKVAAHPAAEVEAEAEAEVTAAPNEEGCVGYV
jgi:hypothetical protein